MRAHTIRIYHGTRRTGILRPYKPYASCCKDFFTCVSYASFSYNLRSNWLFSTTEAMPPIPCSTTSLLGSLSLTTQGTNNEPFAFNRSGTSHATNIECMSTTVHFNNKAHLISRCPPCPRLSWLPTANSYLPLALLIAYCQLLPTPGSPDRLLATPPYPWLS
jgi:hypothetical protein